MRKPAIAAIILLVTATFSAAAAPNGLVILFTDYGADSIYVGVLRGAIYTKFPEARIDTLTNSVPSFDILAGAYILNEAYKEFPQGTTFCCVVDPGVGTQRKSIAIETQNGYFFVAPDNGLLSLAAQDGAVKAVHEITNQALFRAGAESNTFHGRDIYGPISAALASGVPIAQVGPQLETFIQVEAPACTIKDNTITGEIIRQDPYGNLITNIRPSDLAKLGLAPGDTASVHIGDQAFKAPLARTYSDVPKGQKVIVTQSMGFVECAVNLGSLAETLGQGLHAKVTLKRAE